MAGEPGNAEDFLYRRIPNEQRRLVTADFLPSAVAGVDLEARWDIVLGLS